MKIEDMVSEVRAGGISSTMLSDANLQLLIARAFRIYNRYRPRVLHSTITTVGGQEAYAIEEDAIRVIDVFWEPAATTDIISRLLTELELESVDFNYPSLLTIFHVNRSRLRNTTAGAWSMYGSQIRLRPVPTSSGSVVPYIYAAQWADVDDIPIGQEDVMMDGVMAMANMALARARVGTGGWRAGDYQVEGGSASAEMERASSEYDGWIHVLAGAGVGTRS